MTGSGVVLHPSQRGGGVMLGDGITNLTGTNGSAQGEATNPRKSHYNYYPLQRYNV